MQAARVPDFPTVETVAVPAAGTAHVAALDCLRGVAALGVVWLHVGQRWEVPGYPEHLYLAVPFFFSLSGYVIARAYEDKLRSGMTLTRFAAVRAIRLYPMLAVSLLVARCLGASWTTVLMGLLFVPSGRALGLYPANPPQWSLAFEIAGNLAHAALLRWLTDGGLAVLVFVGGAGTACAALRYGHLGVGWGIDSAWAGAFVFLFCYGTGVLIHRLERRGLLPVRRVPLPLLVVVYAAAAGVPESTSNILAACRDLFCAAIIFPAIVVCAIHSTLPRWLARASRVSGEMSYPLYVLHHPIVSALTFPIMAGGLSPSSVRWAEAGTIVGCALLAYALFRWFDVPLRRRLSRLL